MSNITPKENEVIDYSGIVVQLCAKSIDALKYCVESGLTEDDFRSIYTPLAPQLYGALTDYYKKYGRIMTIQVLRDKLAVTGLPDKAKTDLLDVFKHITSPHPDPYLQYDLEELPYFVDQLRDSSIKQQILDYISTTFKSKEMNNYERTTAIASYAQNLSTQYSQNRKRTNTETDYFEELKKLKENKSLRTGYTQLDAVFNGFKSNSLTIITGVVSTGKSTFMAELSRQQLNNGKRVLVISLEEDVIEWQTRIFSAQFSIPYTTLLDYNITEEEIKLITNYPLPNYIVENYNTIPTISEICALIKSHIAPEWQPDIVFIDQLSKISPDKPNTARHDLECAEITTRLKFLSNEISIPIVLCAQTGRSAITTIKNVRTINPNIENLEHSNAIGADADSIFGIIPLEDSLYPKMGIKIIKQRKGVNGVIIPLCWNKSCMRLSDSVESVRVENLTLPPVIPLAQQVKNLETTTLPDEQMELFTSSLEN